MADPSDIAGLNFSGAAHDHRHCLEQALKQAEVICQARHARLTALRRRVLELIWSSHAPIGAYDLLRRLSHEHERAAPPTVYRALDFLLAQGLIHRIESLNAFVGCAQPDTSHGGQFLICRDCGQAAELQDKQVDKAIDRGAAALGFVVESRTVELRGLCPGCQEGQDEPRS